MMWKLTLLEKKEKSTSTYSLEKDYLVHHVHSCHKAIRIILTVFKTQSSQDSGCL